jgi:hypothetical protein
VYALALAVKSKRAATVTVFIGAKFLNKTAILEKVFTFINSIPSKKIIFL